VSVPDQLLPMPYPGLRPFEAEDQALFFGREAQVEAMLRCLEDDRFLAVVGSSGCGKSSLVRAGLLPAVREGFLLGVTDWRIVVIKPGHQPYLRLAHELARLGNPAEDQPHQQTAEAGETTNADIFMTLRKTDHGLLDILDSLEIKKPTIIVVDQFEELFSFRRENAKAAEVASRDEAAAFVKMLLRTCDSPSDKVWVLLTMRSDFIGNCEAFLGLPEAVSRSQFLVPRLDRSQMEEAIRRPGEVTGAAFAPFSFEEGLVNRIINEAGDRPDQLPLMQHALMRTWKLAVQQHATAGGAVQLMHDDYNKAGGIAEALSRHADAAWDQIKGDPKKASIARQLFLLLCDVSSDGQITRRRPRVREVEVVTGATVTEIDEVIRLFQADNRNFLILSEPISSDAYIDISHEALLRQWQLFATQWLVEEREDWSELRRLTELARLMDRGMLSLQDLYRVDRWKKRVSAEWACRYVSKEAWDDALAFITDSRHHAEQTSQKKTIGIIVTGAVLVVATVVSLTLMFQANAARDDATNALINSYLRTIGTSSPDEIAVLWELAELESSNSAVREGLLARWFQKDQEFFNRAFADDGRGLRAVTGLNHTQYQLLPRIAVEPLVLALEDPNETDSHRLSSLGQALAALAPRLGAKDAAGFADGLAKALENPKETDSDRLSSLEQALAALAPRLGAKDAADFADGLAKALEDPKETDSHRLSSLGQALAALAPRLGAKDAADFADGLAKALEDPKETDSDRLSSLGQALAALAPRLGAKDAADFADGLAKVLENPKETDSDRLSSLGQALAALAPRLGANDAASYAGRASRVLLVKALVDPITKSWWYESGKPLTALAPRLDTKAVASLADPLKKALDNPKVLDLEQLDTLGEYLALLAPRLVANDTAGLADRLEKALEDPEVNDELRLRSLGRSLVLLAPQLRANDAAGVADRLVSALNRSPVPSYSRSEAFQNTIPALAPKLETTDAASVAGRLVLVLENSLLTDAVHLSDQGQAALIALIPRLQAKDSASLSARAAKVWLKALNNPKVNDYSLLSDIEEAMAALAPRLEEKDATSLAKRLLKALERISVNDSISALGKVLAALAPRLEPKDAASVSSRAVQVAAKTLRKYSTSNRDGIWGPAKAVIALAPWLEARPATNLFELSVQALTDPDVTDSDILEHYEEILAVLAPRVETNVITSWAERLVLKMEEDAKESKRWSGNIDREKIVAALIPRLKAKDAASLSARAARVLGYALSQDSIVRSNAPHARWNLGFVLAELAPMLEGKAATSLAEQLVTALEDSAVVDSTTLTQALIALTSRLDAKDATSLAQRLVKILERENNLNRLSELGEVLAALVPRLEPKDTASLAHRLVKKQEDIEQYRAEGFKKAMAALAQSIPPARNTQLLVLSFVLLGEISSNPSYKSNDWYLSREIVAALSTLLSRQDLAEVLKWPFCVGEAETIVLAELEKKTGKSFGGNVWTFVELAPALGVKNLDQPAKRPRAEDAIKELENLRADSVPR
jgi:hypothetical protein